MEELVALIDIYRRSEGKANEQINAELLELSSTLAKRANGLGIDHGDQFLNQNGMKMMFQNITYIATDGQRGGSAD